MINNGHNIEKTNFDAFINAVGSEIQQAQVRLITAANAQMLFHYWKMGNYILYHQQLHGWGSKTIKQLAKAIRLNFPEKKGYSELLYVKPLDDGLVGIADKADRYPHELSAGEQQRVGIARAIVNQPRVLIADEPTGNLDPKTAMEIMNILEKVNVRGTTILMVTHAKDIVDRMNKRVVTIEGGRIVRDEQGSYGFSDEYDYVSSEEVDKYVF